MRVIYALMVSMSVLIFTGCEINSNNTKIQYMPDMADAPTVKAQEDYLDPPPDSVPINGILYPKTLEEAEKVLQNPFPVSDAMIADGKRLYDTFCVACHGENGNGENSLQGKFPQPPDITTAAYKKKRDGFYFHRITFGSAIMPSYGHSIAAHERWKITHYVRKLQQ